MNEKKSSWAEREGEVNLQSLSRLLMTQYVTSLQTQFSQL